MRFFKRLSIRIRLAIYGPELVELALILAQESIEIINYLQKPDDLQLPELNVGDQISIDGVQENLEAIKNQLYEYTDKEEL